VIKSLRTDGGGEYTSREFENFLKGTGIVHRITPPHTPAQNGIAERANRTLMEGARCMLFDAGLGNEFWGYALTTMAHIMNRLPSRVHDNRSPYELWTGNTPSIGHLRVFGAIAHVHVPAENRRKLDPRSKRCILVGYAEDTGSKVYRLLNQDDGKIIVSRDVIFD
jgi:transposase InsO family protein